MADRHDARYVSGDDPRAVLRAWGGDHGHETMDMGGWMDEDEDAFREAVQDESKAYAGSGLPSVLIERVVPDGAGR